ncbi:RNase P/RNase MRP complex subunit [Sparganum proliferum]
MASNTFAEGFARKRILSQQQGQSDFSFENESGAKAGLNYQSLVPAAGKPRRRPRTGGGAKRPPRNFRRQSAAELKRILGIRGAPDDNARGSKLVCPSDLPLRLHNLWVGYCETVLNLAAARSVDQLSTRLETVLRMDLIGAHLRVKRSTSTRQAGLEGIVVMETRNVFYIADLPQRIVDAPADTASSPAPSSTQTTVCTTPCTQPRLHIVPKGGTLFVLVLGDVCGLSGLSAEIVLNGSALAYRPVDRALRKWRLQAGSSTSKKLAAKRRIWQDTLFCAVGVQPPEDTD